MKIVLHTNHNEEWFNTRFFDRTRMQTDLAKIY